MNGNSTASPKPQRDLGATLAADAAPKPQRDLGAALAVDDTDADTDTDSTYLAGAGGLVCALLDAARAVSGEVEARAEDAHMTVAQARLARHFADSFPGIPMSELAFRSGMTAPAITQMLRRMTAKGLVIRSEGPRDGRAVLVRLTERGQREFLAISARLVSFDRELGKRAAVSPEVLGLALSRLALSRLALSHLALSHLALSALTPPRSG
jgi:DNA-binding MarR family transcriptional regulator